MNIQKYCKHPVLAGDQNGFAWDSLVKLFVLQNFGFTDVQQQLHSADMFSQLRISVDKPKVVPEAYNNQGDLTRWTASCECADFLGRMPISPQEFLKRGVDFKRIARFIGRDVNDTVMLYTAGDWLGVVLPSTGRVAEDVHMSEINSVFAQLSRVIRRNFVTTFCGKNNQIKNNHFKQALSYFDAIFNLGQYDGYWGECMASHWKKNLLDIFGVNGTTDITTSVKEFELVIDRVRDTHPFFCFFYDNYHVARDCYNQAVGGDGEDIVELAEGGLPFYVILRDYQTGKLRRQDLKYQNYTDKQNQDPIRRMLTEINIHQGKIVALLGKALTHVSELRMRATLAIPRRGSAYLPKTWKFENLLRERLNMNLSFHPLLRVDPNALDALKYVEGSFYLPEYLCDSFGVTPQEFISASDFGNSWREVVTAARKEITKLQDFTFKGSLDQLGDRLKVLTQMGIVHESTVNELLTMRSNLQESGKKCGRLVREKHSKSALEIQRSANHIRRQAITAYEDGILKSMTDHLRNLIGITNLMYWNARPFAHWILALPGWKDAICKSARIDIDSGSVHQ